MTHDEHQFLGDEILLGYVQGKLSPAEALLVATQYHMCPTTRQRLKELNACAAAAVEDLEPKPMRCCPHKFFEEKCLKSKPVADVKKEECATGSVPKPLIPFVGDCFDKIAWSSVLPGIQQKRIKLCGRASAKLMKIAAGTTIAEHAHRGEEYTLVLRGSFIDGDTRYNPGYVAIHTADDTVDIHAPYADQECICLVVLTGPIALSGWLGRVLNPILRWNY